MSWCIQRSGLQLISGECIVIYKHREYIYTWICVYRPKDIIHVFRAGLNRDSKIRGNKMYSYQISVTYLNLTVHFYYSYGLSMSRYLKIRGKKLLKYFSSLNFVRNFSLILKHLNSNRSYKIYENVIHTNRKDNIYTNFTKCH